MAEKIIIYTDGACTGNPGHGGYGAVLMKGNLRKELSEGYRFTTNNRMEMLAVIVALQSIKDKDADITIHTDSRLIVDAIEKGWVDNWKRRGWKKADKKPVLNQDLWMRMDGLLYQLRVSFKWVKGHAGIEENERCDELATTKAEYEPFKIDNVYESENPPSRKILHSYEAKLLEATVKPVEANNVQAVENEMENEKAESDSGAEELIIGRTVFSYQVRKDEKIEVFAGSRKLPVMSDKQLKELGKWLIEKSNI